MATSSRSRGVVGVGLAAVALGLGLLALWSTRAPERPASTAPPDPTAALVRGAPADVRRGTGREGDSTVSDLPPGATRHEAHDPLRPVNGEQVRPQPDRLTAMLARRKGPLPACPDSGGMRASGTCVATLGRAGSSAQVALSGAASIDEKGTVHIESGSATVTNLTPDHSLLVVDPSGRSFTVPPLGKVDVDERPAAPVAAAEPAPASSGALHFDPRTGPPRLDIPPPSGPRPGPPAPILSAPLNPDADPPPTGSPPTADPPSGQPPGAP